MSAKVRLQLTGVAPGVPRRGRCNVFTTTSDPYSTPTAQTQRMTERRR